VVERMLAGGAVDAVVVLGYIEKGSTLHGFALNLRPQALNSKPSTLNRRPENPKTRKPRKRQACKLATFPCPQT